MNKLILLAAVLILSPVFLKAQSPDPELDYIKSAYSKDKKTIVEQYMALDAQQGAKFWPLYAEYESQREKLAVERLKYINEYIEHAANLSPELADKIADATLSNSINLDKLNHSYYGKIKKEIGAIHAAKYIQLETYLQTAWRGYVQENIPLIGELDKTQKN